MKNFKLFEWITSTFDVCSYICLKKLFFFISEDLLNFRCFDTLWFLFVFLDAITHIDAKKKGNISLLEIIVSAIWWKQIQLGCNFKLSKTFKMPCLIRYQLILFFAECFNNDFLLQLFNAVIAMAINYLCDTNKYFSSTLVWGKSSIGPPAKNL